MKKIQYRLFIFLLFSLSCKALSTTPVIIPTSTQASKPTIENAAPTEFPNSALVDFYDPARDPAADLRQAIAIAQKENKHIMLELGGDWCIWCKYMDDFYATHADILQVRAENYVLIKINVSSGNDNAAFLAQFPEAAGYPHIYILDSRGNLLHSQNTADLEDGKNSYNPEVFMAFLKKWTP